MYFPFLKIQRLTAKSTHPTSFEISFISIWKILTFIISSCVPSFSSTEHVFILYHFIELAFFKIYYQRQNTRAQFTYQQKTRDPIQNTAFYIGDFRTSSINSIHVHTNEISLNLRRNFSPIYTNQNHQSINDISPFRLAINKILQQLNKPTMKIEEYFNMNQKCAQNTKIEKTRNFTALVQEIILNYLNQKFIYTDGSRQYAMSAIAILKNDLQYLQGNV